MLIQAIGYYDMRRDRWLALTPLKEFVARRISPLETRSAWSVRAAGAFAGAALAALLVGTIVTRITQSRAFIYFQF